MSALQRRGWSRADGTSHGGHLGYLFGLSECESKYMPLVSTASA